MSSLLADRLREAHIEPQALPLDALEAGLDAALKDISIETIGNLVRLGCSTPVAAEFQERFREAIRTADAAFPLRGEDLYVSVLSVHAVIRVMDGTDTLSTAAALLTRSARFSGWQPAHPDLYSSADGAMQRASVNRFKLVTIPQAPKRPPTFKQAIEALGPQDMSLVASAAQEIVEELSRVKSFATTVAGFASDQLLPLQEQTEILWWLFSGWSVLASRPFEEIPEPLRPTVLALDMASLTRVPPGPPATNALLEQALKLSSAEATNPYPNKIDFALQQITNAPEPQVPPYLLDFCPMLSNEGNPAGLGRTNLEAARQTYDEAMTLRIWTQEG